MNANQNDNASQSARPTIVQLRTPFKELVEGPAKRVESRKAIKLFGPEAEEKARSAIRKGWLYTRNGFVIRKTQSKEVILIPFAMHKQLHVKVYFLEYELFLSFERVRELEEEYAQEGHRRPRQLGHERQPERQGQPSNKPTTGQPQEPTTGREKGQIGH